MSGGKRKRAGSRILQKDYLINLGIAGYMGGYSVDPKNKIVEVYLYEDRIEIYFTNSDSWLEYSLFKNFRIEYPYERKVSIRWMIFFGIFFLPLIIVPLLWKKKRTYTEIHSKENTNDESIIIDFHNGLRFVRNFLNKKILESRKIKRSRKYTSTPVNKHLAALIMSNILSLGLTVTPPNAFATITRTFTRTFINAWTNTTA